MRDWQKELGMWIPHSHKFDAATVVGTKSLVAKARNTRSGAKTAGIRSSEVTSGRRMIEARMEADLRSLPQLATCLRKLGLLVALGSAVGFGSALGQTTDLSFTRDVAPILSKRCTVCHHGPNAQKGLRMGQVADLLRGGESGAAIAPGEPDRSLLLEKVAGDKPVMPPAGDPMTEQEIEILRRWIAAGAQDDSAIVDEGPARTWWSFLPLTETAVPTAAGDWGRTSIDAFLLAAMQEKGLMPSEETDRRTLVRRLSFDLQGLPPAAETVQAFVNDPDPDAYARLVDAMLAAPAYGERWGRHWLDVVRFGESNGYEQNHLRNNAWPYRDWVIRSFNEDKPFNRMILEQLAGDQLGPSDPEVQAATGFLVAGPHDTVGIRNPAGEAQKRANHLDDMIMGTASAFLGLTVHCARCHDHKFDPIRTTDYYRMQSAFAGVWHGERVWDEPERVAAASQAAASLEKEIELAESGLERLKLGAKGRIDAGRDEILGQYRPSVDQAGTSESFEPVDARIVRMSITGSTTGRLQVDLDEFSVWTVGSSPRNVALGAKASANAAREDAASSDTYTPANLVDGKYDKRWISGSGLPAWVQVELPHVERIGRVEWSSDRLGGFGGRFARSQPERYTIEVSTDGESWSTVASSQGRLPISDEAREKLLLDAVFSAKEKQEWEALVERRRVAQARLGKLPKPRRAFLGNFEQPDDSSFVMVRGDPMNRGEEVAPGSLTTLEGLVGGFKLALDAPESKRRIALAEWIASDKNALTARVIVNRVWMRHFGQPFVRNPSDFGINGGEPSHPELLNWLAQRLVHRYGWRLKPLHREIVMSAAYRQSSSFRADAARVDRDGLYLWRYPPRRLEAEELRDSILLASGNLDLRMGGPGFRLYRYTVDNVATYYPLEEFSPDTYRRSVYHQHARSVKPALLGEFDCPDTSLPAPKRIATTSPLQALSLLNNAFVLDQASAFANRVRDRAGENPADQISEAWQIVFAREPSVDEVRRATAFVAEHGLAPLGRALLNANEFLYVF